jgi:hypothetical protein
MLSFWAKDEGDITDVGETGDEGFLRGIVGLSIEEVAKVLKTLENFIIPAYELLIIIFLIRFTLNFYLLLI